MVPRLYHRQMVSADSIWNVNIAAYMTIQIHTLINEFLSLENKFYAYYKATFSKKN